jgi:hypothetical protein
MGATTFGTKSSGKTAKEAFAEAVQEARYMHGHGGYSGTIAEKRSFTMITPPSNVGKTEKDLIKYAWELIDKGDPRVDDKWGPAGCIALPDGKWFFFGWASE